MPTTDPVHKIPTSALTVDNTHDYAERIIQWNSHPDEDKEIRTFGGNYCFPVYTDVVGAGVVQPIRRIDPLTGKSYNGPINVTTIPYRSSWVAAGGSDAAIIARDPSTGKHYGFWAVGTPFYLGPTRYLPVGAAYLAKDPDGLTIDYRTSTANMRGATGSGYLPHPVLRSELEAGLIAHWVPMYIRNAKKGAAEGFAISPAGNFEQSAISEPTPNWNEDIAVPMGTRWGLDPAHYTDAFISAWASAKYPTNTRLRNWATTMAKALRDYGAFTQASGPNGGYICERITDMPEDLMYGLINPAAPHVLTYEPPTSTLADGTRTTLAGWAVSIAYDDPPDPDPDPDPPTVSDLIGSIELGSLTEGDPWTATLTLEVVDADATNVAIALDILSSNLGSTVSISGDITASNLGVGDTPIVIGDLDIGTYTATVTGDDDAGDVSTPSAVGFIVTADNATPEPFADSTTIIPTEYGIPNLLTTLSGGIMDLVASKIVAGANTTVSYNTSTKVITIDAASGGGGGGLTAEDVRDIAAAALVGSSKITVTNNDAADTITLDGTVTQYTDELARDAIGAALVGGSNVTITPNDGSDTITIAVSGFITSGALDTDSTMAANSDTRVPSQKAVKTHVAAEIAAGIVGSGGGFGPHTVAASNSPTAIKTAVSAAGGAVCDGTADQTEIQAALNTYRTVQLVTGTYNISSSISVPRWSSIRGLGQEVSVLKAATGLTGRLLYLNNVDQVTLSDFTIDGNGIGSNVAGIESVATDKSSNASWRQDETCNVYQRLVIHDTTGRGLVITGTYNRDNKLDTIHVFDAGSDGFYITSPDGKMSKCVTGSAGGYGFHLDGASNWHLDNCKAWYSVLDGFIVGSSTGTARITHTACEAQDNRRAGFRMARGNMVTYTGCIADSNSYVSDGTNTGTYSGFEMGLTDPTTASSYVTGGLTITGCVAYDKSEGSRGYRQAYGFRFGGGMRRLSFTGFNTGDASNHHNLTDGVRFNTTADATNTANVICGLNHGVILSNL